VVGGSPVCGVLKMAISPETYRKIQRERVHELVDRLNQSDLSLVRQIMGRLLADKNREQEEAEERVRHDKFVLKSFVKRNKRRE